MIPVFVITTYVLVVSGATSNENISLAQYHRVIPYVSLIVRNETYYDQATPV